jgi:hypothetical protein
MEPYSEDAIVLQGDLLKYWKEHSGLIETISELEGDPSELVLDKELFTHVAFGDQDIEILNDTEWNFLSDILTGGQVAIEKNINGRYILNYTKGYNKELVTKILDYILYDKPRIMIERFKANILPRLPLKVVPRGAAPQKYASKETNPTYANDYEMNWPLDNIDYNENNIPSKKNTYRSFIKINNNTKQKPYAKTRGSRYRRSATRKNRRN